MSELARGRRLVSATGKLGDGDAAMRFSLISTPEGRDVRVRRAPLRVRKVPLIWAFNDERMTGIEPALSAWEAEVLPLNYIRVRHPEP